MKSLLKVICATALVFISCTGTNYRYQNPGAENLTIPIVFHVRSRHDIKRRIPIYWKRASEPLFWDGKIIPVITDIRFDVPTLKPDMDSWATKQEFYNMSSRDGKIHVFFVHKILENGKDAKLNGVYFTKGACNSFILIQDRTDIITIAHEIGHYLSLEHVKDDTLNVMNDERRIQEADFEPQQINKMRRKIREQRILCNMPVPRANSRPKIH